MSLEFYLFSLHSLTPTGLRLLAAGCNHSVLCLGTLLPLRSPDNVWLTRCSPAQVWIAFLFIIAGVVQMARSVSKSLAETSRVRSSSAHRSVQIKRRLFRQLSLYLVIFVIVWLPGTINRILEAVKSPLVRSEMLALATYA